MDAIVQNRCEHEVLALIKGVAAYLDVAVVIETEALEDGSLKRIWRLVTNQEENKAPITTAVITAIVVAMLAQPVAKFSEKIVDKLFEDTELKQLEKEKLRLEVKQLRSVLRETPPDEDEQIIFRKRSSNFYAQLEKYPKVDAISVSTTDNVGTPVIPARTIPREQFNSFIVTDDSLPPKTDEHAWIEIVSPVLKKGRYKWVGIYQGTVISFMMKSHEFKELVQDGLVEFKNGSSIDCVLQINRKIGNDGQEKIVGYEVVVVNRYFENESPVETIEGRRRRDEKRFQKEQQSLFE